MKPSPARPRDSLYDLVDVLPSPLLPREGRRAGEIHLPNNIICFRRRSATDLNSSQAGRALHDRYVLILVLETAATIVVDDREIRLRPEQGLLVLPFQFHHYIRPEREKLNWLFVTFELMCGDGVELSRYRPFVIDPAMRALAAELVACYLRPDDAEQTALLLALLLSRSRRADAAGPSRAGVVRPPSELMQQINQLQLAQPDGRPLAVKDIARRLGISESYLRTRFRISCEVSLGRHLRRMRLGRACALLRYTTHRVSDIAELCGFASIYSFSRAFHAAFGISPLRYRHGAGLNGPATGAVEEGVKPTG